MLASIVSFSIRFRGVVAGLATALLVYGLYDLSRAGLDIFPEFAPKLVIVQTEAPGYSAEQVEVLVSRPLEAELGGLSELEHVRAESIAGLSIVTLVFGEHADTYRNRALVAERLATVRARLPAGVATPVMAPLASSSATVRTIGLTATDGDDDPVRLREMAEVMLVPRLLAVPGVADVNVFGGAERALVVTPDAAALAAHGLAPADLAQAVRAAFAVPGLGYIANTNQQIALAAAQCVQDPEPGRYRERREIGGDLLDGSIVEVFHDEARIGTFRLDYSRHRLLL